MRPILWFRRSVDHFTHPAHAHRLVIWSGGSTAFAYGAKRLRESEEARMADATEAYRKTRIKREAVDCTAIPVIRRLGMKLDGILDSSLPFVAVFRRIRRTGGLGDIMATG
ncbi:hypothetical protein RQP46_002220 [Phenoliferia psychrophenolica]